MNTSGALLDQAWVITMVGVAIVFLSLFILYQIFFYLSKILNRETHRKLVKEGKIDPESKEDELMVPGDVAAAIGMALYLNDEVHDEESNIITIRRVSKSYSPWSSKIYGLRKSPR
ncbi:MAG: OadG family protein [Bacteroidales bacterium]